MSYLTKVEESERRNAQRERRSVKSEEDVSSNFKPVTTTPFSTLSNIRSFFGTGILGMNNPDYDAFKICVHGRQWLAAFGMLYPCVLWLVLLLWKMQGMCIWYSHSHQDFMGTHWNFWYAMHFKAALQMNMCVYAIMHHKNLLSNRGKVRCLHCGLMLSDILSLSFPSSPNLFIKLHSILVTQGIPTKERGDFAKFLISIHKTKHQVHWLTVLQTTSSQAVISSSFRFTSWLPCLLSATKQHHRKLCTEQFPSNFSFLHFVFPSFA